MGRPLTLQHYKMMENHLLSVFLLLGVNPVIVNLRLLVKSMLISIDQAQNVAKVKPLVDGYGWEYEVLLDPNSDFKRAMGVNMIPAVFIIDGDGKIAESRSGYTDGSESHLIDKVRELIAKKK